MALIIASSTACTVASKKGVIISFGNVSTRVVLFLLKAPSLAVENTKNIFPEPLLPPPPTIPIPRGIR
jgi:hypothetical protein